MYDNEKTHFEISDLENASNTDINRFERSKHLATVERHIRTRLRDRLIVNGVYMKLIGNINKKLIADQLMEPLQAKDYHKFTQKDEIERSDKRVLPTSKSLISLEIHDDLSTDPI
ncbi:hypothetical protein OnM2_056025 [Erysiphe neolycopersici]|uniref:Uncharacterized protein n=1 Tax=Erysiphe neolycopersici TaxID=212602 RepID=A0A420HQX6_9PEZI|nr:hypothetical protein OnM2_056025 [Erysiphe neolycopersici]